MRKKLPLFIIVVILLAFAGAAIYSRQKAEKINFSDDRQQALDDATNRPSITINTKHQFKNGMHTFVGTVEVPSPCYSTNVEVKKNENITELAITYTKTSVANQVCAEVIEERAFKATFAGTEEEDIIATLNGEVVNLNVFEIGPDENINDAEIFIKG